MDAPRLRILCLSNMYPGPSDPDYGAFVATMCEALERRGHQVRRAVISSRGRGGLRTPAKYLGLAARAVAAARGVDVVYAHYLFPTGAIAAACGLGRRPWVLTAHGQDVRNLERPWLRRMSAPGIARAAAVICVSRYLEAQLRATGLRLPPLHVANMGVDLTRFTVEDRSGARARLGLPAGRVVLAVGGLTERKNPLRLVAAMGHVRAVHPDARLVLVGDGPLRDAVRAEARRLDLEGAVTLTGAVPHRHVAGWMAAADVLALPSLVEPLGVVALEALASGRPVAATRIGGVAEVIGDAGTLVDPRDPASIAGGLVRLLDDPPSPRACRAAAEVHGVDGQAGIVAQILWSAAAR